MTATLAVTPDYVIGDTWDLTATIRNELGTGPFNLTGCTVLFTLKRKSDVAANDNAALVKLSWVSGGAATGIAVATPTSGVAAITVPSSRRSRRSGWPCAGPSRWRWPARSTPMRRSGPP
jgi:hypothetical protein